MRYLIEVRNKQLLFGGDENYLGTVYDNNSANRVFKIARQCNDGVDIAHLNFYVDIKYRDTGFTDTIALEKELRHGNIYLTWLIGQNTTKHPGTNMMRLRAYDDEGVLKWSTYEAPVYVEPVPVNTGDNESLTELEQIEQAIRKQSTAINQAEEQRVKNESDRQAAEEQREQDFTEAINEFNTSKEELKNFAEMSESYCHGGTGIREGEDEDNAKKYCERAEEAAENAEAYSEAIAPTFVINEETMELKQTGGKNIDFNLLDDGNLSFIVNNAEMAAKILGVVGISFKTEPYSADTHYSYYNALYYENSAYLCINKNGVQGVTPADDGVNWKYLCKGSGAELSGITAKDTEGLVGDAGADVAAQALLDELADRVANKLLVKTDFQNVLKGFLVNAGTTTLEGFAADARQLNDTIDGTLAKRVKNNEAEISELTSGLTDYPNGEYQGVFKYSGANSGAFLFLPKYIIDNYDISAISFEASGYFTVTPVEGKILYDNGIMFYHTWEEFPVQYSGRMCIIHSVTFTPKIKI